MTLGIAISAGAVWPAIPVPLAIAGWALTGLGMGLLYPSLSVVLLSLSPPTQQGADSSALQLSEAIAVAAMLALAGALFAALLTSATSAALPKRVRVGVAVGGRELFCGATGVMGGGVRVWME